MTARTTNRFCLMLGCVAALALAGCGAGSAPADGNLPPGVPAAGGLPALPQSGIDIPLPRAGSADESASFDGQDFTAQAGANNQNLPDGAYQLGAAQGAVAWARYSVALPATHRLFAVTVDLTAAGTHFIGVANYGDGRWEWLGPFTTGTSTATFSTALPRGAYASPGNQAHCIVLSYAPADTAPQPLGVAGVMFEYTDAAPGTGWATYTYTDGVYRIRVEAGAEPENVSLLLDAISPQETLTDSFLNISPDGQWLALVTNRFDPEAAGWNSLAVMRFDLSDAETVRAGGPEGVLLHPESLPAIANGGNLVVYSGQGGPHIQDLWAIRRADNNADWGTPVLLTAASEEDYNENPAISADGMQVLFHCGPTPYGQEGTMAARVNTDGTGYTILKRAEDQPVAGDPGTFVRSPDWMPDGSYIFETDWALFEEHRTWHQPLGGGDPVLLSGGEGANSPCALPDGRIVHLWLGSPDNPPGYHELTVMDPDGTNWIVLVPGIDVVDSGHGAGGS